LEGGLSGDREVEVVVGHGMSERLLGFLRGQIGLEMGVKIRVMKGFVSSCLMKVQV